VQYKTANVESRKIVGRVTASGTLQAVVTVQVGTQVSGRIQHLYADFNSPVKKGQLIAKIDPQLFQAAVAQAHANHASAEAGVTQAQAALLAAQRTFDRTKSLHDSQLASQADLDISETNLQSARAAVDVAKASLEQAKAQLNQAEVNLSYTNIMSPIDGTVISRNVDVGQTVAASLQAPVIFTIAEDLRKMQVNTNVAEGDVGRLQPGMAAFFTVDAFPGQRFNGKISQIRNAAQTLQNVVTYDAVIDVDNAELRLRPGMTANTTVIFEQREKALAVPNSALRFRPPPSLSASTTHGATPRSAGKKETGDARTVWVLRSGSPEPVTLKTGLSDGTWTEVVEGDVKEGDATITDTTGSATPTATTTTMRRMF
jgi:HlyD family secretion protein